MFMMVVKVKIDMIGVGLYIVLEFICKRDDCDFIIDF